MTTALHSIQRHIHKTSRQYHLYARSNNAYSTFLNRNEYKYSIQRSPIPITSSALSRSTLFPTIQSRTFATGILRKISRFFRVIFGANETSPRGIQERQDSYWLLLSLQCRSLRMQQQSTNTGWEKESKDQIRIYLDEAADLLDQDSAGLHDLSLGKLRKEVQTRLEPQILDRLLMASMAEEEFGESDDGYIFDESRVEEFKDIMRKEYEDVSGRLEQCDAFEQELENGKATNRRNYYRLKKAGIERLLIYYDWLPQNENTENVIATELNSNQGEADEFGFCPSQSSPDVIPAMRYHHAKNLIRSFYARNNTAFQNQQFSIMALKSTVPNAGRGVYVDGYAPAGTLLAFFPGKIWPKDYLMTASLQVQMNLSDNDPRHQLSMRYDDILIDSRRSPYSVYKNMFSLAHVVNHPPIPPELKDESPGDENNAINRLKFGPNCVTVPINFTKSMLDKYPDRDLKSYIPNEYEVEPKPWAKNAFDTEDVIMNGMGIVSQRDVHDEELFYDYRLSPGETGSGGYPDWYYVWNEDAINNRWNSDE
eukprot:scaffold10268_cov61-Cyclotella_meneghiniana.AAC.5